METPPQFSGSLFGVKRGQVQAFVEEAFRDQVTLQTKLDSSNEKIAELESRLQEIQRRLEESEAKTTAYQQERELLQAKASAFESDLAVAETKLVELGEGKQAEILLAQARIEALQAELEASKSKQAEGEESKQALHEAQQALDELRQGAERERQLVIDAAHRHAEDVLARAQRKVSDEGWELRRTQIERQRFIDAFRTLLSKYLEDLDRLPVIAISADAAPAARPAQETYVAPAEKLTWGGRVVDGGQ